VTAAGLPMTPATPAPARPGGWRSVVRERISWRVVAASLALGFVLGGLLTTAAWTAFGSEQVGVPKDVSLVIPNGTAAAIRAGGPATLPSQITLVEGDRLVISNQDVVDHTIGGWQVAAGMVLTIVADVPATNIFACTIHPSGALGIIIQARPGLIEAIFVTILVSVPIGLVLAAGWTVFRMLDTDDTDFEKAA
jgi:hypothetical protein